MQSLPAPSSSIHYRADIDGLRALAVLSVVLFHAFPRWLAGGYVGVDVFFVISGYLISSILFTSLQKGTFSFVDFYSKRARRIFPALITVLFFVCLFGWYVLTPDEFSALGKHIAAGSGFVSNIALWLETGYFDTSADVKPLLHLWSLGVEEQFYIIWPFLLFVAARYRLNFLHVCVVLWLGSFLVNIAGIGQYASSVFYWPITRFWELLSGATLAYFSVFKERRDVGDWFANTEIARMARAIFPYIGLILLVGAIIGLDKSRAFPGWWAVIPVLGTGMIIAAGPNTFVNRVLLGNRLMVGIGLISYPVYLWHTPMLAFGHILLGNMSKELRLLLIAASFALALCTYLWVEKRFRTTAGTAKLVSRYMSLPALYLAMLVYLVFGLTVFFGLIPARNTARDVDHLLAAQHDWDFPGKNFSKYSLSGPSFYGRAGTDPSVAVFIGDSIVEQYGPRVDHVLSQGLHRTYSVVFATGPGCPPIPNVIHVASHTHPTCRKATEAAYALARTVQVKKVIIGGNWDNYLQERNSDLMYRDSNREMRYGEPGATTAALASLEAEVALLSKTKKVYILLNSPKHQLFSPKRMFDGSRLTKLSRKENSAPVDITDFMTRNSSIRSELISMARRHGAKVIDPVASLCRDFICPSVSSSGEPLYMDHEHLRPGYVREKASFVDQTVLVEISKRALENELQHQSQ